MTIVDDRTEVVQASRPRQSNGGRVAMGALLVVVGAVWLAERLDWIDIGAGLVLPLLVTAVGVVLLALSFEGEHPGLVTLGVILAVITLLTAVAPTQGFRGGIGDRRHEPVNMSDLDSPYRLGIGSMRIDLSDLRIEGTVEIEADVGMGELLIIVPDDVAVDVEARSGAGEVRIFGERSDGIDVRDEFRSPGSDRDVLVIDAGVFMGQVEVRR
ncbi:MAG: cell wall-active antibiotics response protein [Acidimicrobiia bacterium]|nr:cell wall-active antibiotics response protein [Acidimicrobiia bacterium]